MYKLTLIPIMLALAASPAGAQKAPSAGLLEQGIYAEETIGDLKQAIAIYSKIVQDEKARRPEVAQALFRLAVCHSNLGQKDKANQLFRQLMEEYAPRGARGRGSGQQGSHWGLPAADTEGKPAPEPPD